MSGDYHHTWTFDRNSWFIRAYCWLWVADEDSINFCKLWWGFWFAPLALLFHTGLVFMLTVRWLALKIAKILPEPVLELPKRSYIDRVESQLEKPPNKFQRFLTAISEAADRVVAFWQEHDGIGFWLLLATGTIALYGAVIGISFVLVYGNSFDIAEGIWLPIWFWWLFHKKKEKPDMPKERRKTPLHFLGTGYWALKHRTCPRVVIRDQRIPYTQAAKHGEA